MACRPVEYRVTVLDNGEDLLWYHLDDGVTPDEDGNVRMRADDGGIVTVPLRGLYRVQQVENGIPAPGPGLLMTPDQFQARFTIWRERPDEAAHRLLSGLFPDR